MTSLHERFAAMADAAGPPSRLSPDEVYTAARRRRRTRVALSVAGGLAALLVAGTAVVLPELSRHDGATFGQVQPSATGDPGPYIYDGAVYQVVAADAQHLYALMNRCTTPTICTGDLVGTDDGGKTWTMRTRDLIGTLAVHSPGVLTLDRRSESKGAGSQATEQISTSADGGRTWTQVTTIVDTTPVPDVPAGGWLGCVETNQAGCLYIYRPGGTHRAPLANQPALLRMQVQELPTAAGLWVSGMDPSSHHTAITVSQDHGRTWSPIRVLATGQPDYPSCANGEDTQIASVDGVTAYAVVMCVTPDDAGNATRHRSFVFRTSDSGLTWQRVDHGDTLPFAAGGATSYIAADGTHVVETDFDNPSQWWSSRNAGDSYQHAQLPGLPATRLSQSEAVGGYGVIAVVGPGLYLAFDRTAAYRSINGLDWTRIPISVTTH